MSVKFAVASLLVLGLLAVCVQPGEAWFWGRRSSSQPRCAASCAVVNSHTCDSEGGHNSNAMKCKTSCGRKRRSAREIFKNEETLEVVPMSHDFAHYDRQHVGGIKVQEFADGLGVAGIDVDSGDVRTAFHLADANGDGTLSSAEFQEAPFVFDDDR